MNGKTVKCLRKLARTEGASVRSVKKKYLRFNQHERASVKRTIKQTLK